MTYKIGTRIRKKVSPNKGIEGVVTTGPATGGITLESAAEAGVPMDFYVKVNKDWISVDGQKRKSNDIGVGKVSKWEPIVPEGNAPSEFSFTQLLDNLKEEQYV